MLEDLRHLSTESPRVLVVDGSRVVRMLIAAMLRKELPAVRVAEAGGTLEIESAPGEGTAIAVSVPAVEDADPVPGDAPGHVREREREDRERGLEQGRERDRERDQEQGAE